MTVSVFAGMSLDGFIARPDGALDFLDATSGDAPADDHGFAAFMARTDAIVMGRATYDVLLGFDAWPYGKTPLVVLSHRPLPPGRPTVERMQGEPADIVARLAKRGLGRLYVDGGRTVQSFLAAGLVDELVLTRVPVLIGQGIPLFGSLPGDVRLRHEQTTAFPDGLVQTRYTVRRGAPPEWPRPGRAPRPPSSP